MYHRFVTISLIFYTILPNVLIQGDMTHSRTELCRWRAAGAAMRSRFLYSLLLQPIWANVYPRIRKA